MTSAVKKNKTRESIIQQYHGLLANAGNLESLDKVTKYEESTDKDIPLSRFQLIAIEMTKNAQ